jgi:maleate isomerase
MMTAQMKAPLAEVLTAGIALDEVVTRHRIGLVALSSDLTLEKDIARLTPVGEVCFYTSRVEFINPVTPENLRKMQPHIAGAARLILTDHQLDAICYGCTSASATLGDQVVFDALEEGRPGTPATNPALAGVTAAKALGASNIALLTPYPEAASQKLADYFASKGCGIISHHCLNLENDRDIAHVNQEDLIKTVLEIDQPGADAVFLSCTSLPAVEVIRRLEDRLGKPVITSNQAMIWMALRLAGCDYQAPEGGRLFTLDLPQ